MNYAPRVHRDLQPSTMAYDGDVGRPATQPFLDRFPESWYFRLPAPIPRRDARLQPRGGSAPARRTASPSSPSARHARARSPAVEHHYREKSSVALSMKIFHEPTSRCWGGSPTRHRRVPALPLATANQYRANAAPDRRHSTNQHPRHLVSQSRRKAVGWASAAFASGFGASRTSPERPEPVLGASVGSR